MATVTSILDRLHEINALLTGCNKSRYWLDNFDNGIMPIIVPRIAENQISQQSDDLTTHTRVFMLDLFVGNMMGGKPRETMQKSAEVLIEAVYSLYRPRIRLELTDASDPLVGVEESRLDSDTGMVMYDAQGTAVAMVMFTLTVTYSTAYATY